MGGGIIFMTAFISQFMHEIEIALEMIRTESFTELYASTSLEVGKQCDVKALYKQVWLGEVTGINRLNDAQERPYHPD